MVIETDTLLESRNGKGDHTCVAGSEPMSSKSVVLLKSQFVEPTKADGNERATDTVSGMVLVGSALEMSYNALAEDMVH
jgi:hypothetical protein